MEFLLGTIAFLLFMTFLSVTNIEDRLKAQFPIDADEHDNWRTTGKTLGLILGGAAVLAVIKLIDWLFGR